MEELRATSKSGVTYRIINSLPYPQSPSPGVGCFEIEYQKRYDDKCVCWWPALHKPGAEPKLFANYSDVLAEFNKLLTT